MEAADYASINRGTVTFPSLDERWRQRSAHLEATTFTRYHDLPDGAVARSRIIRCGSKPDRPPVLKS